MNVQRLRHLVKHTRMVSSLAGNPEDLLIQSINSKGVITWNRPNVFNAFNLFMIRGTYQQLQEWDSDDSTSLVIIKGTGDKAFSSGGDLKAVTDSGRKGDGLHVELYRTEYSLNYKMGTMKKPLIAIVNGMALGGAVGLSVHGRYRVATEKAIFALPECSIGLFPDAGAGYVLLRMKGQLGTFLGLTCHWLKGKDTLHAGYATHYVESAKVGELEQALLELKNPSFENVDEILNHYNEKCQIDKNKPFSLASRQEDIDRLFSGNTVEEIFEALHEDRSEWALEQLEILRKMSPTSLKLGLHLLREGANTDLAAVVKLDYRISQGCMRAHDFYEGVRARLIDKDQEPRWNPAKLEDVTPEIVKEHLRPLDDDLNF
ncbi:3-hydroxyisobutyryl-CoA hydrolase, mitochondrial [Holothuria leucospilota]|uniref:3-hydroxyisobutyryl-CoA hydrolase, mitochondrial n=1 Tax=Holothuria leucospilota TaxID=206669 RepID=A0A9Q1H4S2_HOLLE|nr:3-hydroxyisobutyryl-CoA hydrolase, mitochondrial [Holothuria leucospilota]